MNLRPANQRDIPRLLELLLQVGKLHHGIRPDIFADNEVKYEASALEALLCDPARPIFVAEEEEVVAYCFCVHKDYDGTSVFCRRRELYIDDLCVDENHRGRGIGRKVFAFIREYARQKDITHITLNVWLGNDAAMAFYEAMGMHPRNIIMEMTPEEPSC